MLRADPHSIKTHRVVVWLLSCVRDPMDYSLPGSSVHGIFQARILEWVAISFKEMGISLTQESNPSLQHWQADSLSLSHLGSPLRPSEYSSPISLQKCNVLGLSLDGARAMVLNIWFCSCGIVPSLVVWATNNYIGFYNQSSILLYSFPFLIHISNYDLKNLN